MKNCNGKCKGQIIVRGKTTDLTCQLHKSPPVNFRLCLNKPDLKKLTEDRPNDKKYTIKTCADVSDLNYFKSQQIKKAAYNAHKAKIAANVTVTEQLTSHLSHTTTPSPTLQHFVAKTVTLSKNLLQQEVVFVIGKDGVPTKTVLTYDSGASHTLTDADDNLDTSTENMVSDNLTIYGVGGEIENNIININKLQVLTGDYNGLSNRTKYSTDCTRLPNTCLNAMYPLSKFADPFFIPQLQSRPEDLKHLNQSSKQFGLSDITSKSPGILVGQSDSNLFPTNLSDLPELYQHRIPQSLAQKYPNLTFSVSKITNNIIVSGSLEQRKGASNISQSNDKKIVKDTHPIDQKFLKKFFEEHKKSVFSFMSQFGQRVMCPFGTDPIAGSNAL